MRGEVAHEGAGRWLILLGSFVRTRGVRTSGGGV
jgi:hypothetical protein